MKHVCRETYVDFSSFLRWVSSVKGGDSTEKHLHDQSRSGRSENASDAINQAAVRKMIFRYRRVKQIDNTAKEVGISIERKHNIILVLWEIGKFLQVGSSNAD
ncbi:hypothetical protein PoB_003278200 [Plakobranchus ocellatus]|uniref:Uncharacterized protein n=1 Tax=Plakobranchus ocellatus TaxID=259542 RepID=A0AAV4AG99_9GAST|nr:hypothetical protein PoB_003278200 [Plakobranchus ocellatus]